MKIFALDDEYAALGLLEDAIKEAVPNAEVEIFDSPIKMLEAAKVAMPDVVFSDIEMPGMSGLELATKLFDIKANTNLFFVTGFSEYALDALKMYASGYLLKPIDSDDIKDAMTHLRYPIDLHDISIKTFGYFSVYVDGSPIKFRLARSKELLAYLVDREGASISRREAAATLYEDSNFDRQLQKDLSRAAQWLEQDLESAGIANLFNREKGMYSVNTEVFKCDLYDYLKGEEQLFHGEYMEQYSWGEDRKGMMYD